MNSFAADKLKQAFDLITEVDKAKVRKAVQDARNKNSNLSNEELAIQFFDESRLKAAAAGFALGMPGNLLTIVPAAIADITLTTRAEVFAAACVSEIFQEGFLDADLAKHELLVPVFGASALINLQ